jgi:hypothetical protein
LATLPHNCPLRIMDMPFWLSQAEAALTQME